MSEQFDFSTLQTQQETVTLPDGKQYILKEASGAAVAKWRNAQLDGAAFNDEGKVSKPGNSVGNLPLLMVGECLFDAEGKNKVPPYIVAGLPEKILSKLYDWVLTASELQVKPNEAELKNA